MKQILLALLLAAMLLTGAVADEITIDEPKTPEFNTELSDMLGAALKDSVRDGGAGFPVTTDVVTLNDDGSVNVVTEDVSMTVFPPFGSVALTQDLLAQLDVYLMYDDPSSIVESMIADDTHIIVMDLAFYTQIYFDTTVDTISGLVGDIDEVSEAILLSVKSALQNNTAQYDVSVKTLGENTFLVFDYRKSGDEYMIYTSVKNNTNIDIHLIPGGDVITDAEIENLEYMLTDAVFTAA